MTLEQLILFGILIAVAVIAYYLRDAVAWWKDLQITRIHHIHFHLQRPPAPPKPILMKERVYMNMGKIYFPFLLPEVPKVGSPVKRIVVVSYNGEVVKTFEDAPLKKCRLDLWPDADTEVTVATYTVDASGNVSETSSVTFKAEDVYPPPKPPQAELLIDEIDEVEDDESGEIEIVPLED